CEDDGAGIEEATLDEIRKNLDESTNNSQHYGIYNVHRRIKLMYKGDYGLDISSKKNEGTTVRLTIPKHLSKEE
ncbi:MAG: sensor histidine kinase, partial [Butyrivibrio sp.]|nr:sensor histidine kinase [Butyrivibrio sp.]